jgi:CheY-like chemotaxis protein
MLRVLGIPEYLFFKLVHAAGELEIGAMHGLGVDGALDTDDLYRKAVDARIEALDVLFGGHLFATAGQYDPAQAATNTRKLVTDPMVVANIGPEMSGEGTAMTPILSEADLATITPSSTNPDITDPKMAAQFKPRGRAIFFRTVTTDAFQGPNMANFYAHTLKVKSIYILDDSGAYGVGIAAELSVRSASGSLRGPRVNNIIELLQPYRPLFEILNAAGSLLAIITWLIAFPLILHNLRRGRRVRVEFSLMGIKAAAFFGGAAEQWAARTPADHPNAKAATVARTMVLAFDPRGRSRLRDKRILWVDDHPSSVALEIQGFEALGAVVTQRLDTKAALQALAAQNFDLVISDMGRPPDDRAGYTLLGEMRQQGLRTPFLIYSGSKRPEQVKEAFERGAQGATNDPEELLALALDHAR